MSAHADTVISPLRGLDETVVEWDEGRRLVISIDSATVVPISSALATFLLLPDEGTEGTRVSVQYTYRARGGRMSLLTGPLL